MLLTGTRLHGAGRFVTASVVECHGCCAYAVDEFLHFHLDVARRDQPHSACAEWGLYRRRSSTSPARGSSPGSECADATYTCWRDSLPKVVPAAVPSTIGCNVTAPVPVAAVTCIPAVQPDAVS